MPPVILLSINRALRYPLWLHCDWTVYVVTASPPELRNHVASVVCRTDSRHRRWCQPLWSSVFALSSLHSLFDCFDCWCFSFFLFLYFLFVFGASFKPAFKSKIRFSGEKRWGMIWNRMTLPYPHTHLSPLVFFLEAQQNTLSFLSCQR